MKNSIKAVICSTCFMFAASARADLITFDPQAAHAPNQYTGVTNNHLAIDDARFSGGELLNNAVSFPADPTGIYATRVLSGGDQSTIRINFTIPVTEFSLLLLNGGAANESYVVKDSLNPSGFTDTIAASAGGGGKDAIQLNGDLTWVDIAGTDANWNFAIDDVFYVPATVPEPSSVLLLLAGSLIVLGTQRLRRRA